VSDAVDAQALRAEIAQTREELGHTVEVLAARMDVKERARQAAKDTAQRARRQLELAGRNVGRSPVKAALLAGTAAGLLAVLIARVVQGRRA
jgi:hypothetical protein